MLVGLMAAFSHKYASLMKPLPKQTLSGRTATSLVHVTVAEVGRARNWTVFSSKKLQATYLLKLQIVYFKNFHIIQN